jgi:predicted enzyme related to lactoylglutathione lyase
MKVNQVFAVISSGRLEEAKAWYSRLFHRPADLHPMASVYEWHFGNGGVQLVDDAKRAGTSMLTVIVPDLEALRRALEARQLTLGPTSDGDFARFAQIADNDGNQITFAQPGPAQTTS